MTRASRFMAVAGLSLGFAASIAAEVTIGEPVGIPPCGYDADYYVAPDCGIFEVGGRALAVNNAGVTVGWLDGCPNLDKRRGFIWWPDGTKQVITVPGMYSTEAVGINDSNLVLLKLEATGVGYLPAIWNAGEVTVLSFPDWANKSEPVAINNSGVIGGEYGDVVTGPYPLAAIWQDGELVDISEAFPAAGQSVVGLNDLGQMAGTLTGPPLGGGAEGQRACFYDGRLATNLGAAPGCVNSIAEGLSEAGHVAVYGHTTVYEKQVSNTHPWKGFIWKDGLWTALEPLPGHDESQPTAINSYPIAVGWSALRGNSEIVIWKSGAPTKLRDLVDPVEWGATSLVASVSDSGVIVGRANWATGFRPARYTPRPSVAADFTSDCRVDGADLAVSLQAWGPARGSGPGTPDLDGNGVVDGADLGRLLELWTT